MQLLLDPHKVPAVSTLVGHAGIEKHAQTQTPPSPSTVGQEQPRGTFAWQAAPGGALAAGVELVQATAPRRALGAMSPKRSGTRWDMPGARITRRWRTAAGAALYSGAPPLRSVALRAVLPADGPQDRLIP
jgi:hypothetical protein